MSHHFIGLDPDEMTPKQLRMALRHAANMAVVQANRKKKDDVEEDDEPSEEEKENDDLVNLHASKKGDSKPPKVTKDDLPHAVTSKVKKGEA